MNAPALWIALAACLLSCYCSAINSALRTFNRKRLAEMLEAKDRAHRLEPFLAQAPRLILATATLRTVLNLLVLLATLYYVESFFVNRSPLQQYMIAFLAAGAALSIFAVAVPASWAHYARERLVVASLPVFSVLVRLQWLIVVPLGIFDPIIRRLSGADLHRTDHEENLTNELLSVVDEHQEAQAVGADQKEMLEAIVEFPSTTVDEIMTPRTDVQGVEAASSLAQIRTLIMQAGHSRYPVYRDSLDDIVGVLYAKDLLRFIESDEAFDVNKIVREPMMVPETKPVRELLAEFKAQKVHIAIVVDEYGGTAGLVTVEDIIEEIVGEIQDEYEPYEEAPAIRRLDDGAAEVDGRVHIDELDDVLGVPIPDEADYDTVGGFVFSQLGHIPAVGERFIYANHAFTVTDSERTRVKRVRVEALGGASSTSLIKKNGREGE